MPGNAIGSTWVFALLSEWLVESSAADAFGKFCIVRPAISFFSPADFIRCLGKAAGVPSNRRRGISALQATSFGTFLESICCNADGGPFSGRRKEGLGGRRVCRVASGGRLRAVDASGSRLEMLAFGQSQSGEATVLPVGGGLKVWPSILPVWR